MGGDGYSWIGPNNFNSNLQNPTITFISPQAQGVYTITITRGPCTNSTTYSLTVWPLPVPTAGNDGPKCETKKLQLSATTVNSVVSYIWLGPNFNTGTKNPLLDSVKLTQSGIYTLTVTDFHGCKASATTSVSILQNPKIAATGDTVCLNYPAILKVTGANTYLWTGPQFY